VEIHCKGSIVSAESFWFLLTRAVYERTFGSSRHGLVEIRPATIHNFAAERTAPSPGIEGISDQLRFHVQLKRLQQKM
jgi:hypothetical protein